MAAAMMRRELAARKSDVDVASAGFVGNGVGPPEAAVEVMRSVGLDISEHRSRLITADLLEQAGLVLAMTRQQLIDLVLVAPTAWTRMFTINDAIQRGTAVGPRPPGQTLEAWAERLSAGRSRPDLLALKQVDDVADPMGGRRRDFEVIRDKLARQVSILADLVA
jgi:protein-tyrosine-phosphatase